VRRLRRIAQTFELIASAEERELRDRMLEQVLYG
jgi:hypothetical protein